MSKPQTFRILCPADLFAIAIETEGEASFITLPVLPAGTFQHPSYGELNWTPDKFGRMITNHQARVTGYEPMLNTDHSTHNPFAAQSPAYGWLKGLSVGEDGGLYARVDLTDLGVEAIQKRHYRYTSAEVTGLYTNSRGEEFQDVICGLALTNTPFHDSMPGTFSRPAVDAELVTQFAQCFATLEGDLSFEEIRGLVSDAVRAEVEAVPGLYRWIEDIFPLVVIYEQWSCNGNRETEKHYKRGYTIAADRTVTLSDEIVEVEEVWVEVARQAFSAARRQVAVQRLGAQTPHQPAVDPATERKSMSQDKKPKTLGQILWNALGFGKTVTEEQFTQALDSAPAPVAEPAEDTPNDTTLSQPASAEVVALRQQVDAQQKAFAKLQEERATEQLTLAKEKAETAIQGFVAQGKITPAMLSGEGGEALREFARTKPAEFAALFNAAPALIPLDRIGRAGEPAGGEGGDAETFDGLVAQIQAENPGMDFSTAMDLAVDQRPDLYRATLPTRSN